MSFPAACCNTPPVKANYTAKGQKSTVGNIQCYFTGPADSHRAIMVNYDVFGYHANVMQLCDILGDLGYRVVLPDLLHGNPLTENDLGTPGVFAEFKDTRGSWQTTKPMYQTVIGYLKDNSASSIGLLGFCWGSHLVVSALTELDGLRGGAIVHPALIADGDLGKVNAPLLAIPSKDEPDFQDDFDSLKQKSFFSKCHMVRFDDMFHGFCGARGDWSNEVQAKRANDAIALIVKFFASVM
ncbi:hypothetical protein LPJ64_001728 [Coemansia asiatica]|uniref:Dienelactone hydrolase domain-containing protein n=1 Tax=Coemansia asiatica TaxID=1052880 RepID=A0A9W8CLR8_9FUNG|nr:hypothetical protein LPJ64_001728 [Coemansia asiatica]KAJ2885040.1 hypothetical protein FB639_001856 [Coemansia asiatica]